jgi:hypothetical protein
MAVLLTMILGAFAMACSTNRLSKAEYWQDRAAKVTAGMSRAEVEKLLPPHTYSPKTTLRSGSAQCNKYWLDEDWSVSILYDYTGIPRDADGNAMATRSPHNKILSIPVLSKEEMPTRIKPIRIKTIQTSKQTP